MPKKGLNICKVTKRGIEYWRGRYDKGYDEYGRMKQGEVYRRTYEEVEAELVKVQNAINTNTYIDNDNITVYGWLIKWLNVYKENNITHSTYTTYKVNIENHIKPTIGNIKLQALNIEMLQSFFNKKAIDGSLEAENTPLSPKTLKNIRTMLSTAFKQAVTNGIINKNVAEYVTLPKVEKRDMRVLNLVEQSRLTEVLKQSENRFAISIILAMFTGMREGEISALLWSDIDFKSGLLSVNKTLQRVQKKNGIGTEIIITPPKSMKSNRTIPLQGFLIEELQAHYELIQADKEKCGSGYNKAGYVICNELGQYVEPRQLQVIFKRFTDEAEISNVNFHALRHTFATRALENGIDIKTVSTLLGHADVQTTLNLYAHTTKDHAKSQMEKLSSLF